MGFGVCDPTHVIFFYFRPQGTEIEERKELGAAGPKPRNLLADDLVFGKELRDLNLSVLI